VRPRQLTKLMAARRLFLEVVPVNESQRRCPQVGLEETRCSAGFMPCLLSHNLRRQRSFLVARKRRREQFRGEHTPVVDCAYGCKKENQEEADKVEENCQ
jgi:hypothetical protein